MNCKFWYDCDNYERDDEPDSNVPEAGSRNAVLADVLAEIESTESISSDDCLWIPKEDLRKVLSKYFS